MQNFEDRWPCLNCRKFLWRMRIYITMAAETIIKHRAFESTTIIVIVLNCVTLAMEDPSQDEQPVW